ncbi:MAG: hypothetical protein AAFX65_09115 [Cyanobacteria bacterium J06638_7]
MGKDSGLIYPAVNVRNLTPAAELLPGIEVGVYAMAAAFGVAKRPGERRTLPHTPESLLAELVE